MELYVWVIKVNSVPLFFDIDVIMIFNQSDQHSIFRI